MAVENEVRQIISKALKIPVEKLTPETKLDLFPSVTLRPRGGIRLRLCARAAASSGDT